LMRLLAESHSYHYLPEIALTLTMTSIYCLYILSR
jgi:hypothetical protein